MLLIVVNRCRSLSIVLNVLNDNHLTGLPTLQKTAFQLCKNRLPTQQKLPPYYAKMASLLCKNRLPTLQNVGLSLSNVVERFDYQPCDRPPFSAKMASLLCKNKSPQYSEKMTSLLFKISLPTLQQSPLKSAKTASLHCKNVSLLCKNRLYIDNDQQHDQKRSTTINKTIKNGLQLTTTRSTTINNDQQHDLQRLTTRSTTIDKDQQRSTTRSTTIDNNR